MFARTEKFYFLSPPDCTLMMSGVINRPGGWEPNPRGVFRRTYAHVLMHTLKASPAGGAEMLVSLEMPVETLRSPFTHRAAGDKRADKWKR